MLIHDEQGLLASLQEIKAYQCRCWTADEMEKLEAEITKLEWEAIQARTAILRSTATRLHWYQAWVRLMRSLPDVHIMNVGPPQIQVKKSNAKKAKTHRKAKETPKGASRRKHRSRSRNTGRI